MKEQANNAQADCVTFLSWKGKHKEKWTKQEINKRTEGKGLQDWLYSPADWLHWSAHCLHERVDKASLLTDKASPLENEASPSQTFCSEILR